MVSDDVLLMEDGEPPRPIWVDEVWDRLEPFLFYAFEAMQTDDPEHLQLLAEAIRSGDENALVFRVHGDHLFVALRGAAAFAAVPWSWVMPELRISH